MTQVAGYKILEELYTGREIAAYHCLRLNDQKTVILKFPIHEHPSLAIIASLQREYHLLKQLNLSGLIKAYDLFYQGYTPVLVLEDVEGQSLHQFLGGKALSLDLFFSIALQLVETVSVLHQRHVIHKDIKPANIIINPVSKLIKLADLSISSRLTEETQNFINPSMLEGTLAYISPEQTGRMNRAIDYRTDFYSLGVTFFEMLTGVVPFQSTDVLELVHCHLAKTPPLATEINPNVPMMISRFIAKLLAKMPEDRYASMVGLQADLEKCAEQWHQHKKIAEFELGLNDINDHLHISQTLFGREKEIAQLLAAFKRAKRGNCEWVLVSGYAGVGKTSLVKEIHKPITKTKGYFIQGKYDQLQVNTPYTGLIEAFHALIRHILSEPETRLNIIREKLTKALEGIGQVMVDLMPELVQLIGPQTPVPEVNATDAQNRFMLAFKSFINVFACEDHPLVIFLDDLQWADNASLQLIENLLMSNESRYLLMIGAYRDNEVDTNHPLEFVQSKLLKNNKVIDHLFLQPLDIHALQQLLSFSLGVSLNKIKPLALLVHEKTHGNPFFTNEFLKSLYQEKLLIFSYDKGEWEWNLDKIKDKNITNNVVDLLKNKLAKFPEITQDTLKLAACIGHYFTLQTLLAINEHSLPETIASLWEAHQENLIRPVNDELKLGQMVEGIADLNQLTVYTQEAIEYQFVHDRIQEAAYALIPAEAKEALHLKIARLLYKANHETSIKKDEEINNIVQHYNQAAALIEAKQERMTVATLNLQAGLKAKSVAAYQAANTYFVSGVRLLPADAWLSHYQITFDLYRELAENEYINGRANFGEKHLTLLFKQAKNKIDKAIVYQLKIQMLMLTNNYTEALSVGLEALRLFRIRLPLKPKKYHLIIAMMMIKISMFNKKIPDLLKSQQSSHENLLVSKLFSQLMPISYMLNRDAFALLTLQGVRYFLKNGYAPESSAIYLTYAMILLHVMGRYEEAFAFVDLASQISEQYESHPTRVIFKFTLGSFIKQWKYPLKTCLNELESAYTAARAQGDFLFADYTLSYVSYTLYALGRPLNEVAESITRTLVGIGPEAHTYPGRRMLADSIAILQEDVRRPLIIDHLLKAVLASQNNTFVAYFYAFLIKFYNFTENFQAALSAGEAGENLAEFLTGTITQVESKFYFALAMTSRYAESDDVEKKNYWKKLSAIREQFKRWSKWCPENYKHYLLILEGEMFRIEKDVLAANNAFDQAIESAKNQECLPLIAVASMCAARTFFNIDKPHLAKHYLLEAYYAYQRWGAFGLSNQLIAQYPDYFEEYAPTQMAVTPSTLTISGDHTTSALSLDLVAVMKLTQTISSEIHLEKLLDKLLSIVLEDAGAQRSVVLVKHNQVWLVEAEATLEGQRVWLFDAEKLDTRKDLPIKLIDYVMRTEETLVIQDTQKNVQAMLDDYIQETNPKSILVMPIHYQGRLRRILYLENKTSTQAFTTQQVKSLQLLISHAAVSLENAYLYYQATHDGLTGLANRNLFYQTFQTSASRVTREDKKLAIFFLDLDYFKQINDDLGHEVGDKLLLHVADQIRACLRLEDLGVRLGGDEFVILLDSIDDAEQARLVAERLMQRLSLPFVCGENTITVSASIGISMYPEDGDDIQEILKNADIALYKAKQQGKNNYQFYQRNMTT